MFKVCPFCGREPIVTYQSATSRLLIHDCPSIGFIKMYNTLENIIERWNKRYEDR